MLRGVVQLLLYRLIYHYALLDITSVTNTKDVAEYVVATYLLYLHVSGQFHLIVGLLLMFGFNLPETHHRYLLASSFTDFWRRINIYWKDFITKLFFYPVFFVLRGL
jgi:D-alanyl-lipoteichoic acid acyltransferase DltB (MBOAT superfamily)